MRERCSLPISYWILTTRTVYSWMHTVIYAYEPNTTCHLLHPHVRHLKALLQLTHMRYWAPAVTGWWNNSGKMLPKCLSQMDIDNVTHLRRLTFYDWVQSYGGVLLLMIHERRGPTLVETCGKTRYCWPWTRRETPLDHCDNEIGWLMTPGLIFVMLVTLHRLLSHQRATWHTYLINLNPIPNPHTY